MNDSLYKIIHGCDKTEVLKLGFDESYFYSHELLKEIYEQMKEEGANKVEKKIFKFLGDALDKKRILVSLIS